MVILKASLVAIGSGTSTITEVLTEQDKGMEDIDVIEESTCLELSNLAEKAFTSADRLSNHSNKVQIHWLLKYLWKCLFL